MQDNDKIAAGIAIIAAGIALLIYFAVIIGMLVLLAVGNAGLARRLGKNTTLWIVLSLVPGVNVFFMYYVMYQVMYGILDRLPPLPPPRLR
jgi:hypothetical protein